MDGWDIAIWAIAGYVAALTLVRFMNGRRNMVLGELRDRAAQAGAAAAQASTARATEGEAKK